MIKPTVGRMLHFIPTADYMASRHLAFGDPSQPLAAVIAYVHSDAMVNLTVWDQNGLQFSVCSVPLVQGDTLAGGSFYAQWMPFQKGQAAKAEELQAKVDVLTGAPHGQANQPDNAIEQEIQAKGLTAPRVTPADIEANIASDHFFTGHQAALMSVGAEQWRNSQTFGGDPEIPEALRLLTFCVLVLRNGFTVIGESACASPENFDAELGRKIARQNAAAKVWPLMGYELRSRLHARALYDAEPKCGYGNAQGAAQAGGDGVIGD